MRYKIKNKMIPGIAIGLVIGIVGCGAVSVSSEQNHPLKIWKANENGKMETYYIVDEETGVNYIVVSGEYQKGIGVAMTPRLNKDGSLYCRE